MDDQAHPSGQVELRASDAERELAVDALRTAAADGRLNVEELEDRLRSAYTVVTRRELESLIADVTVRPLDGLRVGMPAAPGARVVTSADAPGTRWLISIMSGNDRRGRWRIAPRCTVVNVMGGSDLDLSDAELSDRVTQLNVYSVMGGGEVWVPEGVDVHVSKFALMGGNDVHLGDHLPPPGAPVLRVRLVSIMGGCSVRRGPKRSREERRQERELRRAARRDELDA
ncbi:MAG: DUF1707 domain-containing protein [Solirubrobacteraceae bacterium]